MEEICELVLLGKCDRLSGEKFRVGWKIEGEGPVFILAHHGGRTKIMVQMVKTEVKEQPLFFTSVSG